MVAKPLLNTSKAQTKKICILGAESTGTTSLTLALAKHFATNYTQEYGRIFTECLANNKILWTIADFEHIAYMQNLHENYLFNLSHKYLFCDTNSFATKVWLDRYLYGFNGVPKKILNKIPELACDFYFLTAPDIPFVPDNIRDGKHIRLKMHEVFIRYLKQSQKTYAIISGPPQKRLFDAITLLTNLFG